VSAGKDAVERLAAELRTLANRLSGLRWDQVHEAEDFSNLRALAGVLGLSEGKRDFARLREELVRITESTREEEEDDPPDHGHSLAEAWTALLMLDEKWEGKSLKERRDHIRITWKTTRGKSRASVAAVKTNLEPKIYEELALRLARIEGAGTPSRRRRRGGAQSKQRLAPPTWPGEGRKPRPGQDVVVLIAAYAMRRGPTSGLVKLVREFQPYWQATETFVYSLEGSYREIWRAGLLHDYEDFVALPAGFYGGLVHATEAVVAAAEPSSREERVDCPVVYLVDPHDTSSLYPATAAIKRECILTQTPFLTTYEGAARWFRLDWARRVSEGEGSDARKLLLARPDEEALQDGDLSERSSAIALAAHDRHKRTMMEFIETHAELFEHHFPDRLATRVTGHLLNGGSIFDAEYRNDILYDVKEGSRAQVMARIEEKTKEWKEQDRESGLGNAGWITQLTRGRQGGVIQLARRVLKDECDTIVFFQDAETPGDQDMDIQVLDRAAQLADGDCLLLYDERSADRWAENIALSADRDGNAGSTTLVEAFRRVFNVELVLADPEPAPAPKRSRRRGGEEAVAMGMWERITAAAATYVLGVLVTAADERDDGEPVRLGFPWGGAIGDVIGALPGREDRAALMGALGLRRFVEETEAESLHRQRHAKPAGQWPPLEQGPLFDEGTLRVVPVVGVIGALERSLESHSLVGRAARILGGTPVPYPESAFALSESPEELAATTPQHDWERLDILVLSATPLQQRSNKALATGLPSDLADFYDGCVCAVGTIYLERNENHVAERSHHAYTQVGISMAQIQSRKKAGAEVVLVNGDDDDRRRREAAWAALKAGLVSTFVSDEDFAWAVLKEEIPGLKPPGRGR
jgi:methylglyoxal synthase